MKRRRGVGNGGGGSGGGGGGGGETHGAVCIDDLRMLLTWPVEVRHLTAAGILHGLARCGRFARFFKGVDREACRVFVTTTAAAGTADEVEVELEGDTSVGAVAHLKISAPYGQAFAHLHILLPTGTHLTMAAGGAVLCSLPTVQTERVQRATHAQWNAHIRVKLSVARITQP